LSASVGVFPNKPNMKFQVGSLFGSHCAAAKIAGLIFHNDQS